jgi:hypothetical protein
MPAQQRLQIPEITWHQPLPSPQALLHIIRLDVQRLVALLMESPL